MCNMCQDDTYTFNPSTGRDLYDEMTPRIIETDPMGISFVTYPEQDAWFDAAPGLVVDDEEDDYSETVSLHVQLGAQKIVAEFDIDGPVQDLQVQVANALSQTPGTGAFYAGPLIIPAWRVSDIVFASVRTMDEAETFGVHLFGDGS